MAAKKRSLSLAGYEDLFSTEETRESSRSEQIRMIPLTELFPFADHPFKVVDDEEMMKTAESVAEYGVLTPAIARTREEGGYELISGHRRKRAAELAGLEEMPVIVRNLDDDEAVILMCDSNLQREKILPSEKAWAYRMKLEAIKHQGERGDITSRQVGEKLWSVSQVSKDANESERQVQRYIRLTYLLPELLDMVDQGKLAFNPAVEISYLDDQAQFDLLDALADTQNAPSLSQAQRMKKMSQEGDLQVEDIREVMGEEKKESDDKVIFKGREIRQYFPKSYTPQQMQETILKLLQQWYKKRQRQEEL